MSNDTTPYVQFNSDLFGWFGDNESVDVSIDGGQTWTSVWQSTGYPGHPGPDPEAIPLPMAAGQSQVQVRFHYVSNFGYWWALDNVFLGNRSCDPTPGGLVEGVVKDGNTGAGVDGATVTSVSTSGDTATTAPTTGDPSIGDGFYYMFVPTTGSQQLTAAKAGYTTATGTATVTAGAATPLNMTMQAGQLSVTPGSLSSTIGMGGSATQNLAKLGGASKPAAQPYNAPWTTVANYPTSIMDNAVATDTTTGLVYSVGGAGSSSVTAAGYVYNPGTLQWTALPPMQNAREEPQAAFINGKLYVAGGWGADGNPVATTEIYDPTSGTWSTGASIPNAYAGASVAVLNGDMYVIGGCDAVNCGHNDVQVYNPGNNSWSAAAAYPTPIAWQGCGAVTGQIYCAGGTTGATSDTSNAYVYNPGSDSWSAIAPIPIDMWAMGYTAANGQLLLSGGVTNGFSTLTNQGYAYDPSSGRPAEPRRAAPRLHLLRHHQRAVDVGEPGPAHPQPRPADNGHGDAERRRRIRDPAWRLHGRAAGQRRHALQDQPGEGDDERHAAEELGEDHRNRVGHCLRRHDRTTQGRDRAD